MSNIVSRQDAVAFIQVASTRTRFSQPESVVYVLFFFFQAEDGIRDLTVTGVQTCALPISRIVPHALVRRGAYIAPNVVLMPSYVNIGAWVGSGTMVDTWATVGSCAQIGRNVHLSGGVGIGGGVQPPHATPPPTPDARPVVA